MLPKVNVPALTQQVTNIFRGWNREPGAKEGEWHDMTNLTGEEYPVLSTRKKRGYGQTLERPGGLIAKDALAVVDGSKILYNGYEIEMGLSEGVKQLVSMGAYLLIWPDRKWLNTQDISQHGDMENHVSVEGEITATLCRQDGSAYEGFTISETAPEDPEDGELWMDVSGESPALYQWAEASAMWVGIATVYVKLSGAGIGTGFRQYDGVTISGLTNDLAGLNGSHVLQAVADDAITIIGILTGNGYISQGVSVARTVPEMDYVTECGNRIWGCKYGVVDGKPVNEIYASKLGDFKNWNCFQGISTDSYVASRGSDGVFTGAITLQGHPLFFKEDCIEKVYPSSTGAHQIVTTECRGVQRGCWRSLVIVEETVYYKSRSDVCAYGGSLPVSVSEALGETRYSDARAGAEGGLYYLSMKDELGNWHLFCYDTQNRTWHREDGTCAMIFATCEERLWWIDEKRGRLVCRTKTEDLEEEEDFVWAAESNVMGLAQTGQKYISRFTIRAELEKGAKLEVAIRYDDGVWLKKIAYARPGLRSFNVPVIPRRCDHLRLKISGKGGCRVYSVSKYLREGSERAW